MNPNTLNVIDHLFVLISALGVGLAALMLIYPICRWLDKKLP